MALLLSAIACVHLLCLEMLGGNGLSRLVLMLFL